MRTLAGVFLIALVVPLAVSAQSPLPSPPDPAVIGPEAATQTYLATLPPDKRARSDAYFEGGYWLELWDVLWSSAIFLVLLHTGWSARLRDWAARVSRTRLLVPAAYWIAFVLIAYVMSFPLSAYSDFLRERQYGLATQTFSGWLSDDLKELALSAVFGSVLMIVLYAVLRRTGRSWWIWGSVVMIAFLAFIFTIGPVYIAPIFNTYQPLRDESIREPILRMARANGISATEVWEVDASRQTTRISANVSGLFGTERITLNDNLLKRASPAAIQAVMGHEMGHYVLNHGYKLLLSFSVLIAIGFGVTAWAFPRQAARYRDRWHVDGIADPAGLPLAGLILTLYLSALTPLLNTIVRTSEFEADVFGLNAARQPDGFAEAALLLSDYRKLDPGPLEEMVFFDHPSGHTRIFTAMRWKAAQR